MSGLRKLQNKQHVKRKLAQWMASDLSVITIFSATLISASLTSAVMAEPADPIEVKLRYVVLLSTFIRNSQDRDNTSPCILGGKTLETPTEDSLFNKLNAINDFSELEDCKSIFLPATDQPELAVYPSPTESLNQLVITDDPKYCHEADIFLYREGKRIFFDINIPSIEKKPFSLAAQVLALSKPNKCSGIPP